jgi:hypothetical protein
MSQVNTISAARSAMIAVGFIGIVAVGFAVRGDDPADAPLSAADDYGTRHPAAAQEAANDDAPKGMTHGKLVLAPRLGLADDFATRHAAAADAVELGLADDFGTRNAAPGAEAVELGPNDDFGTRNAAPAAEAVELGLADDYGIRHAVEARELGPNDDYATRNSR